MHEVGEVFELSGKKYLVEESDQDCKGCSADDCLGLCETMPKCEGWLRNDKKFVIFIELTEKMQISQAIKDANFVGCRTKYSKDDECEIATINVVGKADQLKSLSDWLKK